MTPKGHTPLDADLAPLVPGYLAARHDDLEALRGHLDAGEFDAIEACGHQILGSGGTYGFATLSQLGGTLEAAGAARDADAVARVLARLAAWLDEHQ